MDLPANFIDLTSMPFESFKASDERDVDNYKDLRNRMLQNQMSICDTKFNDLLLLGNQHLIDTTATHIETFLKPSLFSKSEVKYLYAISIILGMHVSDHEPTLKNLSFSLNERFKTIGMKVLRFTPKLIKQKKVIYNLLKKEIPQTQNIVLILEQTQMIDKLCLDYMINVLTTINNESKIENNIILIFCLASNRPPINHIVSTERCKYLRPNPIPVIRLNQDRDSFGEIITLLLNDDDITFKIGPEIVSLMDNQFIYRDPTIANMKHLFVAALNEHYDDERSFILDLIKSKSDLKQHLDSIVGSVKDLKSVQEALKNPESEFALVDWDDNRAIKDLVSTKLKRLTSYHRYLMSQLSYYYYLLRDETGFNFPGTLYELYSEAFLTPDTLGQSDKLLNAITTFRKLTGDRAVQRLKKCLDNLRPCPVFFEKSDLIKTIKEFYDKLSRKIQDGHQGTSAADTLQSRECQVMLGHKISPDMTTMEDITWAFNESSPKQNPFPNAGKFLSLRSRATKIRQHAEKELDRIKSQYNEEISLILSQLCDKLHNHTRRIKNPLKIPLNEILYFDNKDIISRQCIPAYRYDARGDLCKMNDDRGRKQNSVNDTDSTIVKSISFEDDCRVDVQRLYKIIHEENEDMCLNSLYEAFEDSAKGTSIVCEVKQKTPVKKRKNRGPETNNDEEINSGKLKIRKDHDLLKTRFINAIQDLEYQGIVKRSSNLSKKDIVQKITWL